MKGKSTKKSLLMSVLSLVLCFAMLLGTTYAWFTDSVTSGTNRIVAGNLDVDLVMYDTVQNKYVSIAKEDPTAQGDIFKEADIAQNSNATLWEPGKTQYVYLGVQNKGSLALKYQIVLDVVDDPNNDGKGLAHASTDGTLQSSLEYVIIDGATYEANNADVQAAKWTGLTAMTDALKGDVLAQRYTAANGVLDEIAHTPSVPDETDYFLLAVHMKEDAGNEYQEGDVIINVNIVATQKDAESDSFDEKYDVLPDIFSETVLNGNVTIDNLNGDIYVKNESETRVEAKIPGVASDGSVGVGFQYKTYEDGAQMKTADVTDGHDDVLSLVIDPVEIKSDSVTYNVTLKNKTHNENIKEMNKVMEVKMKIGKGLNGVKVTHDGTPMANNATMTDQTYYYDSESGTLCFYTSTFSPFQITWDNNPFWKNVEISSPEGLNVLPNVDLHLSSGVTLNDLKDADIRNMASNFGVNDLNNALHGANFVAQDDWTTDPGKDDAKLFLENCRQYTAKDEEGYLADNGKYQYWKGDFVIKFNKDIDAFNESNPDNCIILAGEYGEWGWLKFPVTMDVEANEEVRLLQSYMGGFISINYEELCTEVKTFNCGAAYIKGNYDVTDPLIMTIEFRMYETYDIDDPAAGGSTNTETGEYITVDTYTYTFK